MFMSIDPLWESFRSLSPYHYSRNNPLVLQDPSGLADFYQNGKKVGSDGVDDGKKYAVGDELDLTDPAYQHEDGSYDWEVIKQESFEYPGEQARKGITSKVYGKIKPFNEVENGGVVAQDESGEDAYVDGGEGVVLSSNTSSASEAVKKAYDEAISQGLTPTYYVHSHPHPATNISQLPTDPEDYNAARVLGVNGILVTRDNIIFFNAGKARATVPVESFLVR